MPTLDFKGKQHIYAHHLTVPYRPLVADPDKSVGTGNKSDDNLIIHGDNLHALKALLPRHAGRVKCIYIDPPYNTGNEHWVYNDKVNSPLMKAWLKENSPVDGEDLERHDKWLCMMWPRLHLLKELLSEDGVIFVSIDDNEQHHLRMMMDEIFGADNFIACLPTVMNLKGNNDEFGFAGTHEYTFCWAKDKNHSHIGEFILEGENLDKWLQDEYGYYKKGANLKSTGTNAPRIKRPNLYYPIFVDQNNEVWVNRDSITGDYAEILPITQGEEMSWRWKKYKVANESHNIIAERGRFGINLYKKQRPGIGDLPTKKPKSLFYKPEYSSGNGTAELKQIFGRKIYNNPKPIQLLKDIIYLSTEQESIILDSFAGSGTTAQAALALNKEDGGNRKFILVECEDYADTVTAERVRRVISGVPDARDNSLQEGLGGSFTYCTLGNPIDLEGMLTGKTLPAYPALAAYLLHTTAGISAGAIALNSQNDDGLFYSDKQTDYYLLYEPSLNYLESNAGMLYEDRARRISDACRKEAKKAIVFGPGKYITQRDLTAMDITFCQLPYEIHRAGY